MIYGILQCIHRAVMYRLQSYKNCVSIFCVLQLNSKISIQESYIRLYSLYSDVQLLRGTAPRYLQDVIQPVAEVTSRRRLRSASSSTLVVPATRRSLIGDTAFAVAGPRAWNSLPQFVTKCSSPLTFKKYLRTYLLSLSFQSTN